jgi:hypothetical protein
VERIGEIIPSVLREAADSYQSSPEKRDGKVNLDDIRTVWEEIGPFFRKGEPKSFKKNVLTIKLNNSSLLFSYSLQKERLMEELKLKKIPVKDIKLIIA